MNAGWIQRTGGNFLFYHEGFTDAVGRVTAEVDAERIAVAKALGIPVKRFIDVFYEAGLTTKAARDSGDIARACQESEPNKTIRSPPSLDHRYMHEDVGYGLVPIAALGRLCGVKTPIIDASSSSMKIENSLTCFSTLSQPDRSAISTQTNRHRRTAMRTEPGVGNNSISFVPSARLRPGLPGGIADIASRILGAKLTEAWGQQVVVENKPGGNGFIAPRIGSGLTRFHHGINTV